MKSIKLLESRRDDIMGNLMNIPQQFLLILKGAYPDTDSTEMNKQFKENQLQISSENNLKIDRSSWPKPNLSLIEAYYNPNLILMGNRHKVGLK